MKPKEWKLFEDHQEFDQCGDMVPNVTLADASSDCHTSLRLEVIGNNRHYTELYLDKHQVERVQAALMELLDDWNKQ